MASLMKTVRLDTAMDQGDDGDQVVVFDTTNGAFHSSNGRQPSHLQHKDQFSWFVVQLTATAALGGFLFGYDTGVVSGAMLKIKRDLNLARTQEEVVVSITIVGAIIGAVFGGPANQRVGRKPVIIFAAAVFTLGALVMGLAHSFGVLVMGRLVVGLGIGIASLVVPIYIAEAAPSHLRGTLVTLNILLITFGQFCAGMVDAVFASVPQGWRYMLGLSGVPSLAMLLGFLALPESPRWLMGAGRDKEAVDVLQRIRGTTAVYEEVADMRASSDKDRLQEQATFLDLFRTAGMRRALAVGCGLQVLQQLCGINTVMYYSATIYSMAGFEDNQAIWLAGFTALAQAVGVCLGLYLIEKSGRRPLLLASLTGVAAALLCLGTSFYLNQIYSEPADVGSGTVNEQCQHLQNAFVGPIQTTTCFGCSQVDGCGFCGDDGGGRGTCYAAGAPGTTDIGGLCTPFLWQGDKCRNPYGWMAVLSMVMYLALFGIGLSAVPWTVNAEIYPMRYRSLATSVSTSVNWVGNVVISATFLTLASPQALTQQGAFWLYMVIALVGLVWVYYYLPETKGVTLEDMDKLFTQDWDPGSQRAAHGGACVAEADQSHEGAVQWGKRRGFAPLHGRGRQLTYQTHNDTTWNFWPDYGAAPSGTPTACCCGGEPGRTCGT